MTNAPKILYVDDEEDLVMLASSFFEDEGLVIDTATDFKEAVEKIKQTTYDIIISDARMPTGTGLELLTLIKSEGWFTGKFVLVTGNVEAHSEKRKFDYDLIMFKPVKFEELVGKIKTMLSA